MSRRASVQTSSPEPGGDRGRRRPASPGGQYRAVLEVSGVNFGLQGEAEQEAHRRRASRPS